MPKDEKLYQDMRKEFRNRYFNKIAPKLKQYDFERKKRKKAAMLNKKLFPLCFVAYRHIIAINIKNIKHKIAAFASKACIKFIVQA